MKRLRLRCGVCRHQLGDVVRPHTSWGQPVRFAGGDESAVDVQVAHGIGYETFEHEDETGPTGITWTLVCRCRARSGNRREYRLTGARLSRLRTENLDAPEELVTVYL